MDATRMCNCAMKSASLLPHNMTACYSLREFACRRRKVSETLTLIVMKKNLAITVTDNEKLCDVENALKCI